MFFEIYINLQKEILKFRMKLINRILSIIFFISFIGMLIFNFSKEEFFEYYLFQKILFFFIFFLSFLGSFYIDEIEFSKKDSRIIFKRGILFLYKKKFYSFNDFQSLVIKKIAKKPSIINLNIKGKFVYIFGIVTYFIFLWGCSYFILKPLQYPIQKQIISKKI